MFSIHILYLVHVCGDLGCYRVDKQASTQKNMFGQLKDSISFNIQGIIQARIKSSAGQLPTNI